MTRAAITIVVVFVAALVGSGPAAAVEYQGNLLANNGAESALTGWTGTGFAAAEYDAASVPRYPAPFWPADPPRDVGVRLFAAAQDGASISQIVDLAPWAEAIDGGTQPLSLGGLLGTRAPARAARLVAQPLGADGGALGEPLVAGPPSPRDLEEMQVALIDCDVRLLAVPPGTRAVRVSLDGASGALADDAYLLPFVLSVWQQGTSDGPGCGHHGARPPINLPPANVPPANAPAAPLVRQIMALPATRRCGRKSPLRFRVRTGWRPRVSSFTVTARGKRTTRNAFRTAVVAAPRHRLRVRLTVRLRDRRTRSATEQYVGC